LIGSALSIGALFLFLGLPKLTALSQPEVLEQLEPISQHATEVKEEVVELAEEVANEIRAAIEKLPPVMNEFAREDALDVQETEEPTKVPGTALMASESEEAEITSKLASTVTLEEAVPGTMQWQSFWNPFRSEIAANGFVAQLERVTGLDYRVVRVKPGHYEVAFAYLNDAERRPKLSQIEAATGLELSQ
jgi:hypothetical protein